MCDFQSSHVAWVTHISISILHVLVRCRKSNFHLHLCFSTQKWLTSLENISDGWPRPVYLILWRTWMLLTWRLASPGHMQPCNWLCLPGIFILRDIKVDKINVLYVVISPVLSIIWHNLRLVASAFILVFFPFFHISPNVSTGKSAFRPSYCGLY